MSGQGKRAAAAVKEGSAKMAVAVKEGSVKMAAVLVAAVKECRGKREREKREGEGVGDRYT